MLRKHGLLEAIEKHLPEDEQVRLDMLRDRSRWGELSEAEHQELIGYEDLLEQQRVALFCHSRRSQTLKS